MFTVEGYIQAAGRPVSYAVEVGHPDNDVAGYRIAAGSTPALALLRSTDGTEVEVHATGDTIVADAGTPEGVLAILYARTEVTGVEGDDVPALYEPDEHGQVY